MVGFPAVAFRTKSGAVYAVEKTLIDLRGTRMAEHHKKYRSPKTGRVSKAGTYTRNIGRWKFIDKMAVTKASFNKYARQLKNDVGTLKAGWVKGAVFFASKCNGKVDPPSWIARNEDRYPGRGAGGSINEQGFGNLYIENTSPFAKTKTSAAMIAVALRTRERDIDRNIRKRAEGIAAQYNGGQTPQPIKGAA
jgi:hypothetical protein